MNTLFLTLAAIAVRNPFWTIGYEGVREEITAEPRLEVTVSPNAEGEDTATAATAAALAKSSQTISSHHWAAARKTLRITGTTTVTARNGTKRHGVIINGYTYGDGDLISVNHENRRFTWRIQGLTDGATLKLVRVRAKDIDEDSKGED